jgi:predicted O-methyltransferase YrrM
MDTASRHDSKNETKSKYIQSLFAEESDAKVLSRSLAQQVHLGSISLSQNEASFLRLVVHLHQPKRFVEIGTLTGLSAQYIFDGLPHGGELWTFEKNKDHAEKAKKTFSKLFDQEPEIGKLPNQQPVWTFTEKDTLKKIHLINDDAEIALFFISEQAPFDGVFIDGNKASYINYLDWSIKHLRAGGILLADNIFLSGTVWGDKNEKFNELQVQVMKEFNMRLFKSAHFQSTLIPSSDGMLLAQYHPQQDEVPEVHEEPAVPPSGGVNGDEEPIVHIEETNKGIKNV